MRPWVIWHLIEHDIHHGGEIAITLGANGVRTHVSMHTFSEVESEYMHINGTAAIAKT